ncbi:Fis family transcriptional regulator [Oceanicoccus sp. KOV_DT_Chl]|uniref:Fis family transcriptional regulator n=1 Tax=Oceanicoccus sp. KOV_DT_Chl TaxID=1904639 RepID=UPI000C7A193F|nr:Fis family transcriptional regulator [Oceanicoccus sp. KOV_DT_Chl]
MVKPKTKTQKKIDHNIQLALTRACEEFLQSVTGFQWLTHRADYSNFPSSLRVICIFDNNLNQQHACQSETYRQMHKQIQSELLNIGIKLPQTAGQIIFDSEESCNGTHQGNWALRLDSRSIK